MVKAAGRLGLFEKDLVFQQLLARSEMLFADDPVSILSGRAAG